MRLYNLKPILRKKTTPVHLLCGAVVVFTAAVFSAGLAVALIFLFITDEVLEALGVSSYDIAEAEKDCWELELAIFVAAGIVDILCCIL